MKKVILIFIGILYFLTPFLYSQENFNPEFDNIIDIEAINNTLHTKLKDEIIYPNNVPDTAVLIRIPVVFNVIHLGEPEGIGSNVSRYILQQNIDYLNFYYQQMYDSYNQDYRSISGGEYGINTKVEFYLADIDGNCNSDSNKGIYRYNGTLIDPNYEEEGISYGNDTDLKAATSNNVDKYLNIWIVHKIKSTGSVVGYAYYPSAYGISQFGIVLRTDYVRGAFVHEVGHFLGLTHEDMQIGGFTNLHSYKIIRESLNFYKNNLGKPNTCTPQNLLDVGIIKFNNFQDIICSGNKSIDIAIKNYGSTTVNSATFNVYKDNVFIKQYNWNGALTSLDTAIVTIDNINFLQGNYNYKIDVISVNGATDTYIHNNSINKNIAVAGFINAFPYFENFEDNNAGIIEFKSNDSSNVRLFNAQLEGGNNSILLEGIKLESQTGVVLPGRYNSFIPWLEIDNKPFFSSANYCISTIPNSHYQMNYDTYQESWGVVSFKVFVNGNPINRGTKLFNDIQQGKDSVIISSYSDTELLVSMMCSAEFSYDTKDIYGRGSFIVLDNISVKPIDPKDFVMNFSVDKKPRYCIPNSVYLNNHSFGVPMPINYEYVFHNSSGVLDTIRQLEYPSLSINNKDDFSVEVFAHFKDGSIQSQYFENVYSSKNFAIINNYVEDYDNTNRWTDYGIEDYKVFWEKTENIGAYGMSNSAKRLNHIQQNTLYSGMNAYIETESLNLSALNSVSLSFDFAYISKSTLNIGKESLKISYSLNCGSSWTPIKTIPGDELVTVPYDSKYSTNLFIPNSNEWKTELVLVNEVANLDDVKFKIQFFPYFGNAFYIDNIKVFNTNDPKNTHVLTVKDINPIPINSNPFNIEATSSNTKSKINYESSDENIVTIDENGVISVVGIGTAYIKISQNEDDFNKYIEVTKEIQVYNPSFIVGVNDTIYMYPNPVKNSLYISLTGFVSIYNGNGKLISKNEIINNILDLSKLKPGIYFIKQDSYFFKIIKIQ